MISSILEIGNNLSKEIVSIYHGSDHANQALEDFERAFAKKESRRCSNTYSY